MLAGVVVSFCIPLVVLAASPETVPMWIGRCAILVATVACAGTLIRKHHNVYTASIVVLILSLLAVGFIGPGTENSQFYVQIAQVAIFGTVVSTQRTVRIGSAIYLSLIVLVVAVIAANFVWPAHFDAHNFGQSVAIFGNPNTLALCLSVLFLLVFAISQVAPTTRQKVAGYIVVGGLAGLLVEAGSRSAVLALGVYLGVVALGRFLKGDKRVLRAVAVAILLIVPVVTIGYPVVLGHQISFVPHSPVVREKIVTIAPSLPMSPVLSPPPSLRVPEPGHMNDSELLNDHGLLNESGPFGVNKGFASGRQVIWPIVIELSGENLFFGHGLGTLPGAYLPAPYNGLSAHNGFLQIYYQFGVVGLLLYISIWIVVLIRALHISDTSARSVAVAALCAVWFQEIFEVALIQNAFGIGVAFALLITTEFARVDKSNVAA
jgi:hypothetical protein